MIPAHNEAERIGSTIESIEVARLRLAQRVSVSIIVVADGCSDRTADVAAGYLTGPDDVVEISEFCSAGAARSRGAWLALAGREHGADGVWIASTDADTLVPANWLEHQLDLADQGFHAVIGTVALRTDEPVRAELMERFDSEYRGRLGIGADSGHAHIHGANLGVRGDVYLSVGGWTDLVSGEEHDLIRRVRANGWRTVSPVDLVVHTSPRLHGRAPDGFAADLRDLDAVP